MDTPLRLQPSQEPIRLSPLESFKRDTRLEEGFCGRVEQAVDLARPSQEAVREILGYGRVNPETGLISAPLVNNSFSSLKWLVGMIERGETELFEEYGVLPDLLIKAWRQKQAVVERSSAVIDANYTSNDGSCVYAVDGVHSNMRPNHPMFSGVYSHLSGEINKANSSRTTLRVSGTNIEHGGYGDICLYLFNLVENETPGYERPPNFDKFRRLAYVADRVTREKHRNKGIGRGLMDVAERIAKNNDCDFIAAGLVGEEDGDTARLVASHRKRGYKIFNVKDKSTLAAKSFAGFDFKPEGLREDEYSEI